MCLLMKEHTTTCGLAKRTEPESDPTSGFSCKFYRRIQRDTLNSTKGINQQNPDSGKLGQKAQILQQIIYKEQKGMERESSRLKEPQKVDWSLKNSKTTAHVQEGTRVIQVSRKTRDQIPIRVWRGVTSAGRKAVKVESRHMRAQLGMLVKFYSLLWVVVVIITP